MQKVYRLLEWLSMDQALDYLSTLSETAITQYELLQLCEEKHCTAYVDLTHKIGCDSETLKSATAMGVHVVKYPVTAFGGPPSPQDLATKGMTSNGWSDEWWPERFGNQKRPDPLFKRSEIEALAIKMNSESTSSQEKPLHPSERRSIGQIIATLAAMAGLDLSTPYAADETLREAAATHGLELPNSPETVAKFLKDAASRTGKL